MPLNQCSWSSMKRQKAWIISNLDIGFEVPIRVSKGFMGVESREVQIGVRSIRKKAIAGAVCMVVRFRKEQVKLTQFNLNIHVTKDQKD